MYFVIIMKKVLLDFRGLVTMGLVVLSDIRGENSRKYRFIAHEIQLYQGRGQDCWCLQTS